jgi:hypothetical protein
MSVHGINRRGSRHLGDKNYMDKVSKHEKKTNKPPAQTKVSGHCAKTRGKIIKLRMDGKYMFPYISCHMYPNTRMDMSSHRYFVNRHISSHKTNSGWNVPNVKESNVRMDMINDESFQLLSPPCLECSQTDSESPLFL